MARFLALLALGAAAVSPVGLEVRPGSGETFAAVVEGPAPGTAAGTFSGRVALNGSSRELAVSGRAERHADRLRIPITLRYADVPADWVDRFRLADFDYRVRGTVAGSEEVEWSGVMRWTDVAVEGEKETAERFVRLGSLQLTSLSIFQSEAQAEVSVRNPFSFPLKVASARYELFANGRAVGSGETQGLILHPRQENTLDLPVELEHGALIAAAGSALAGGGEIDGRLQGQLQVRLATGDVAVPLDLSGRMSLLSR